jgi:antitoxin (DNA-binding transcriptional repressor) of toxin-antitoxin stability system
MIKVNISEAKNRLSELIRRAFAGEEVIICKRRKAFGRFVPCNGQNKHNQNSYKHDDQKPAAKPVSSAILTGILCLNFLSSSLHKLFRHRILIELSRCIFHPPRVAQNYWKPISHLPRRESFQFLKRKIQRHNSHKQSSQAH